MFDIGFGELMLVMVIGLVVLGPERLPVAVKTIAGWVRTLRSLASTVQNELTQELKLQELQDSLKKVEQASLKNLFPELKASMDKLKEAADAEAAHDGFINAEQASSPAALPSVDQPTVAPSSSLIDEAPPAVVNNAPEAPSATALLNNTPACRCRGTDQ
ncbi:MAG: Sec-independent protein translocase protein TatB [Symbiopectobacterium sp.]|uniref:Sec-independent protein translocase protein TatB n=1 Tax=Symbiopectobacterium sp. TaxID=2952789 RepID=UPI003F29F78F